MEEKPRTTFYGHVPTPYDSVPDGRENTTRKRKGRRLPDRNWTATPPRFVVGPVVAEPAPFVEPVELPVYVITLAELFALREKRLREEKDGR